MQLPPASAIDGRTILITGANTGLGREAARHALGLGAKAVILGVRSLDKGEQAKADIENSTGHAGRKQVLVWQVDLESFASVKAFAERAKQYVEDGGSIDYAIMNAGLATQEFHLTSDGWERTLQVNVISTALLSVKMLAVLQRSAALNASPRPTLTITASDMHKHAKFTERDSPSLLSSLNDKGKWQASQSAGGPAERYAVTKLFNIFITEELARLTTAKGKNGGDDPHVLVNCFTPGFCKSDLLTREKAPFMLKVIQTLIARTVEEGGKTVLHAAAAMGVASHGKWMEHEEIAEYVEYFFLACLRAFPLIPLCVAAITNWTIALAQW